MFECHREEREGAVVLRLQGKLNALTADELRGVIGGLQEQPEARVLLELSGLDLIDSSGVGAIVSLVKRTRASGGQASFVGLQGQPAEIFKLLSLDKAFALHDTLDEALGSF